MHAVSRVLEVRGSNPRHRQSQLCLPPLRDMYDEQYVGPVGDRYTEECGVNVQS